MDSPGTKSSKSRYLSEMRTLLFGSGRYVRIVNLFTSYRILVSPFLLLAAFLAPAAFPWLLLISFLTDAIDGYLARKYKAGTLLGAKLDTIGDTLTLGVAAIAVFILRRDFIKEESFIILLLIGLYGLQVLYACIKYKRMSSFHTYLAKITAVLQACFLLSLFFFTNIIYPLFYISSLLTILELTEELILVYLLPVWKSDVKGIYWILKSPVKQAPSSGPHQYSRRISRPLPVE